MQRLLRGSVWTNIGYLVVAIGSLWTSVSLFGGFLFASLALLAVGSFGFHYHNEKNYFWQKMDVLGMYWTFSLLFSYLGFLLFGQAYAFLGFGLLLAQCLTWLHKKLSSFWVLGILFFSSLILKFFIAGALPTFIILAVFGASFLIRHYGEKRPRLHELFHGIWHIGTSFGILLFLFL